MQLLWKEGLQWDEPLPSDLFVKWSLLYKSLSYLTSIEIPRWTGLGPESQSVELHGFSDASGVAYAAVVYLRVISASGHVQVSLLTGKSRVAPFSTLSVPRLELSGALLLARLMGYVRSSLSLESAPCYCWTDSTIVLAWLSKPPSNWKTFVANRVAEVQSCLSNADWRHVPTRDNPADYASRGILGDELTHHLLWWQGPQWLRRSSDHWPTEPPRSIPTESLEKREVSVCVHATHQQGFDEPATRYSSRPKLIRVTAYILRFASRCRRQGVTLGSTVSRGTALSAVECRIARNLLLKRLQAALFPDELQALLAGASVSSRSPTCSLTPFLHQDGIIRVGGRIRRAPLPYSARHPVLLASHPLVIQIVERVHARTMHGGLQLTLGTLRREFWILRARNIVRTVIARCIVCVRERAKVSSQLMGDLPAVRVTAPTRAFLHCGLDYAGPVHVRASSGRRVASQKAYIALFVCLATRAIHLELVSSCSTPAFQGAFARFCSRRGLPQSVYSDNSITFVGADRELNRSYHAALHDPDFGNAIATDNIEWFFIPPAAPHFGGIWEAGVRSVKHHVRRVLGNRTLTFEEFITLLCGVEACLNSRPIAPLTDSIDDYEPLTPGHFLIVSAIKAIPEPTLLNFNENRLTRWQLVRQLLEGFWKRWSNDYVNTLQQSAKWRQAQASLQLGQLVLIHHSSLPPSKWELGRITACHPGSDGLVRVVTVRTASSELTRPIVKLCPLPVKTEPDGTAAPR